MQLHGLAGGAPSFAPPPMQLSVKDFSEAVARTPANGSSRPSISPSSLAASRMHLIVLC